MISEDLQKLKSEWNIDVSAETFQKIVSMSGHKEPIQNISFLTESKKTNDSDKLCLNDYKTILLNLDIRKVNVQSTDAPHLNPLCHDMMIKKPIFCQLIKIKDISKSSRHSYTAHHGTHSRLLLLTLHNGHQRFSAFELTHCPVLSVSMIPGTKLLLKPIPNYPLIMRNGLILLSLHNIIILGGVVNDLLINWEASKQVHNRRLNKYKPAVSKIKVPNNNHTIEDDSPPKFLSFPVGQPKSFKKSTPMCQPQQLENPVIHNEKKTPRFHPDVFQETSNTPLVHRQKVSESFFHTSDSDAKNKSQKKHNVRDRRKAHRENKEISEYLVQPTRGERTLADFIGNQLSFSSSIPSNNDTHSPTTKDHHYYNNHLYSSHSTDSKQYDVFEANLHHHKINVNQMIYSDNTNISSQLTTTQINVTQPISRPISIPVSDKNMHHHYLLNDPTEKLQQESPIEDKGQHLKSTNKRGGRRRYHHKN